MLRNRRARPGDRGITTLPEEGRVSKASEQIEALGDLDELSAALGIAAALAQPDAKKTIERIQRDLFEIGADLSHAEGSPMFTARRVRWLERELAHLQATLPPLKRFILPGGSPLAAALHLARTICRRAERSVVALSERKPFSPAALAYLNRLSTAIFAMARTANARAGIAEKEWPSRTR